MNSLLAYLPPPSPFLVSQLHCPTSVSWDDISKLFLFVCFKTCFGENANQNRPPSLSLLPAFEDCFKVRAVVAVL